ncbi:shikimate kinase [Halobacillus sp. ACCC02827]|uniref:shikimate kinase n=1 Tax=Bacillaceae TaxID=186817 RepID=UPI0002A517AB|nr:MULTISPECIES: shikimate kinase [Bacillaceae]ELK46236.1 shikimate kinase [Halobacillus sp. BAB-2008]QHT47147.1 shikimate kinase [Bacillus sp. SB49]WJE14374.1 shikimate kinase [Halobacillus sp. ACCC02827]
MIFIVGFMGSGKTTVAEQLGEATGYKAVEMDREIERLEGMTIPEMFERYGEAYFRSAETRFLKGLHGDGIVSTGGGVILQEENRRILAEGTVVYLRAEWETITARLAGDKNRPLWSGASSDKQKRFQERLPYYKEVADITIDVDKKSPQVIAEEIQLRLK